MAPNSSSSSRSTIHNDDNLIVLVATIHGAESWIRVHHTEGIATILMAPNPGSSSTMPTRACLYSEKKVRAVSCLNLTIAKRLSNMINTNCRCFLDEGPSWRGVDSPSSIVYPLVTH